MPSFFDCLFNFVWTFHSHPSWPLFCFGLGLTLNEFLLFLCLFELCSCHCRLPFSVISSIFLHIFPQLAAVELFLVLSLSAAVLFWHSLLSLAVVPLVLACFSCFPSIFHAPSRYRCCCCWCCCCCLLLHTTKLVYPFLLSNISGFSLVFLAAMERREQQLEELVGEMRGGDGSPTLGQ